ncbi:MAG: VanW family protein, partial [Oscillospiraceae bacterium]|nr:VanW family protein [Oscillospiraceae bacterium]
MEGRHVQRNNPPSGDTKTEVRAYPQAKRVYVSPDYEDDSAWEDSYDEEPEPAWDYEETRGRKRPGRWLIWMIPLILVLAAAALVLGSALSSANAVSRLDTIFPNVRINGVDVGGLTPAQAYEKLTASGKAPYQDAAVTVRFSETSTLTVKAEELGLTADPASAVEEAYAYGRSGSLFKDIRAYRAAQRQPVDIAWAANAQINETALREKIAGAMADLEAEEVGGSMDIGEDGVKLVKSRGALDVDAEDLIAKVRQAFLDQNYAEISIEPKPGEGELTEEEALELLRGVYDQIHVEMKNAEYDAAAGTVKDAVRGVSFDMENALSLWNAAKPGETIFIPFEFTEPEISGEDLVGNLYADLLAEKSTSLYGSSYARINNVTLTAQAMDGTVVNPGATFDYNTCLGQRTAARGYQEAGAYSGGKHVTEIGGGICQGSSTLYYCALYSNLKITVRDCHYFTVNYLPLGYDATVSWGGPDFRFVNSRSMPIKIRAWVSGGYLTVQIWGTSDGTRVEMTSDTWEDDQFYYAQTYRAVYAADGSLLSRVAEAYSRYHKYEAGAEPTATPTATPEPTPTPEPTATPEVITPEPITPEPLTPEPLT